MCRRHTIFSLPVFAGLLVWCGPQLMCAQQKSVPTQGLIMGVPAGVPATQPFPGVNAVPIDRTPLSDRPYVFKLDRHDPADISPEDAAVIASQRQELNAQAALAGYDLSSAGWQYQQVACPAFRDYVFLSYTHGPDPNGSSRFVAAIERDRSRVRIVSSYSHGMKPFDPAWGKSGSYAIFNQLLKQERGDVPLSSAPNWLVIGMCYAELTGNHVQVFTEHPKPNATLDMLRLGANRPELRVESDQTADLTFSDGSRPGLTIDWVLHFDRHGQLISVEQDRQRQPQRIALKP
jgi:hypothetical protein